MHWKEHRRLQQAERKRELEYRRDYAYALRRQGYTRPMIAKELKCHIATVSRMLKAAREACEGMDAPYSDCERDEHPRPLDETVQTLQDSEEADPLDAYFRSNPANAPVPYTFNKIKQPCGANGLQ